MGRRLGQHFLSRKSILDRIARAACGPTLCPLVIEIGPGKGALTGPLLELASHVVAIEVDPYLVHYLRQKFAAALDAEKLTLIEGDVLKTDFAALIRERGGHGAITGNLPYYITSPILDRVSASPARPIGPRLSAAVCQRFRSNPPGPGRRMACSLAASQPRSPSLYEMAWPGQPK